MIYKKIPEPHETQEKLIKKNCMLCLLLVNIDQQKKGMKLFFANYMKKLHYQKILLIFKINFISSLYHFQMIKPLRSRGGGRGVPGP